AAGASNVEADAPGRPGCGGKSAGARLRPIARQATCWLLEELANRRAAGGPLLFRSASNRSLLSPSRPRARRPRASDRAVDRIGLAKSPLPRARRLQPQEPARLAGPRDA